MCGYSTILTEMCKHGRLFWSVCYRLIQKKSPAQARGKRTGRVAGQAIRGGALPTDRVPRQVPVCASLYHTCRDTSPRLGKIQEEIVHKEYCCMERRPQNLHKDEDTEE